MPAYKQPFQVATTVEVPPEEVSLSDLLLPEGDPLAFLTSTAPPPTEALTTTTPEAVTEAVEESEEDKPEVVLNEDEESVEVEPIFELKPLGSGETLYVSVFQPSYKNMRV